MHKIIILITALIAAMPLRAAANVAPEWQLSAVDGTVLKSSEVYAKGPTILLFWATWCPYCKALMPHLQSMLEEYRGEQPLQVIAISFREDGDPVAVIEEQGFGFTVVTEAGDLAERLAVRGTPGVFVVAMDGEILLNLYEVSAQMAKNPATSKLNNRQKAARRAPAWAAHIRESVDRAYRLQAAVTEE